MLLGEGRHCLWPGQEGSSWGLPCSGTSAPGTMYQFQPGHVPFVIRHLPGPSLGAILHAAGQSTLVWGEGHIHLDGGQLPAVLRV
jgi:hypothetical protein